MGSHFLSLSKYEDDSAIAQISKLISFRFNNSFNITFGCEVNDHMRTILHGITDLQDLAIIEKDFGLLSKPNFDYDKHGTAVKVKL